MSLEQILAAIPHRPPFLLIDEVKERSSDHIVCRKKFTGEEFWYQGHYPDFPITPGVLLCEAAMQAGAVLLAGRSDAPGDGVPVATRMKDVKFKHMVRPGQTIDLHVRIKERVSKAYFLDAKVYCGDNLAATFSFACTIAQPPDESPPDAMSAPGDANPQASRSRAGE